MIKILLIEDDAIHREEIAEILRFRGFEVETAENGRVGLEIVRQTNPDIILCDILMPEMDGTSVLTTIRADNKICRSQFVFITSMADKKEIRSGIMMGANEYLTKPFTVRELIQTVDNCLERIENPV